MWLIRVTNGKRDEKNVLVSENPINAETAKNFSDGIEKIGDCIKNWIRGRGDCNISIRISDEGSKNVATIELENIAKRLGLDDKGNQETEEK